MEATKYLANYKTNDKKRLKNLIQEDTNGIPSNVRS